VSQAHAGDLQGLVLRFRESMAGHLGAGESDPVRGEALGKAAGTPLRFDVQIRIDDLARFLRAPEHPADLTGTVTFGPLGATLPIRNGRFLLFAVGEAGMRQMTYGFAFRAEDGQDYWLQGVKNIHDDEGALDVVADMTTLFTTVHRGEGPEGPVYGAGLLRFDLAGAPALMASMQVEGARSWVQKAQAYAAFASFAYGVLRDEYLKGARLLYDTSYENLVLSGRAGAAGGAEVPFFLVSGHHDPGFPWGDGELFSDLLLAIGDGRGGWERYCISERVLEGMALDVAAGRYRYRGPIFHVGAGFATSVTAMRTGAPGLVRLEADIEIDFDARAFDTVNVAFPLVPRLVRRLSSRLAKELREHLPGENPLGINITPHAAAVRAGRIELRPAEPSGPATFTIASAGAFGEAERGTFRNVKLPTLLYGYLCALQPEARAARVQIHSRTLRHEREHWARDQFDAVLGSIVSRTSSSEMSMENGALQVRPIAPAGRPGEQAPLLRKVGDPILEVNNDHFMTAVFQRRIVKVVNSSGLRCLALEEDMSLLRLEAVGSDRTVTVAAIRDEDKLWALDRVLTETGFDELLEKKWATSGKGREAFSIAIKPNFMFAYDRRDRSTYTDPELVDHLVRRVRQRGFAAVNVVEAQSTYGEYFDRRSVREVAEYLGYDGRAGYALVDVTLDADEKRYLGPHLGEHPVSRCWREADFRISFAKNKTHAYAYYTLTLKNVYGALPLANKFKEYHCGRGIYATTIEYLKAFPVDYGLVDAVLSADGPFGIFADPSPNETGTVLGGADLVAVDWVAASKMGIEPTISSYMKLAVEAFGKPAIRLIGDPNPYRPWLNVPAALTLFTSKGVDADYHFGNLMYSAAAQMDETHFTHKNRGWRMRLLRWLTVPLRRAFFLRTGENPSLGNRFFSWLFYRLGF
jgi:uncharacterized protein (DUF362 family)